MFWVIVVTYIKLRVSQKREKLYLQNLEKKLELVKLLESYGKVFITAFIFSETINSNVKFRFAFKSNGANENDGFAIDNFILKMPNYVGLHSESFNVSDFSIYPNPAKTEITLLKMNHSEKYQFKIFDIFGRQVKELNWIERRQSLSIEALKTGIYLYQVIDDKGRIFEGKIVKE